jgi:chromate reductase
MQVKILGIAGSLRKGSYNKMLLRYAARLLPKDAKMDIFDLQLISLYTKTRSRICRCCKGV